MAFSVFRPLTLLWLSKVFSSAVINCFSFFVFLMRFSGKQKLTFSCTSFSNSENCFVGSLFVDIDSQTTEWTQLKNSPFPDLGSGRQTRSSYMFAAAPAAWPVKPSVARIFARGDYRQASVPGGRLPTGNDYSCLAIILYQAIILY